MEVAIIAWCVMAVVGAIIGQSKGRPIAGAPLGFLFGPIGWIVMGLTGDARPSRRDGVAYQGPAPLPHAPLTAAELQARQEGEAQLSAQTKARKEYLAQKAALESALCHGKKAQLAKQCEHRWRQLKRGFAQLATGLSPYAHSAMRWHSG